MGETSGRQKNKKIIVRMREIRRRWLAWRSAVYRLECGNKELAA
jgi:hypothetical protein